MIAFDITIKEKNKAPVNIFTSDKLEADRFLFKAVFINEVEMKYEKKAMIEKEFNKELRRRYLDRKKVIANAIN